MSSLCFLVIRVLGNKCMFQVVILLCVGKFCLIRVSLLSASVWGRCTGLGWHEQKGGGVRQSKKSLDLLVLADVLNWVGD